EDAEALRLQLSARGLVAFLAEGAVLPRESGSDRPILSRLVPLAAPPELKVSLDLPHRGAVSGVGIPRGVTVIMGNPFSGRSTLLRAIATGVYPHLPGDCRYQPQQRVCCLRRYHHRAGRFPFTDGDRSDQTGRACDGSRSWAEGVIRGRPPPRPAPRRLCISPRSETAKRSTPRTARDPHG